MIIRFNIRNPLSPAAGRTRCRRPRPEPGGGGALDRRRRPVRHRHRPVPGAFLRQAEQIPINAPVIVDNGGGIYDLAEKRYVLRKLLPDTAMADLAEIEDAFPGTSMELYLSDESIRALHPTERNVQHRKLTGMAYEVIGGLDAESVPVPLAKALFMEEMPQLQRLRAYMAAHGWEERYEMIFSSDHLMELTAKGADKGSMARELKRLTASHTLICIGDHANDLPMLRAAARLRARQRH